MKTGVSLLILLATWLASAHEFSTCRSHPSDQLGVQSISFSPDPPQSGQDVSVSVKGQTTVDLTGGVIVIDIRVMGVSVKSKTFDACHILACPMQAGDEFQASMTQHIPEGTPSHLGATVRLTLTAQDQTVLTCLESHVATNEGGALGATLNAGEFLFQHWKAMHPKAVHNFQVFMENLEKILTHNNEKDKTFSMALNEFGSMTSDEFARARLGFREDKQPQDKSSWNLLKPTVVLRSNVAYADPPEELDWTTKGVVAPVKDQGSCGSCWAFSAIGSLESAYAIKNGKLITLSEQELVSCDNSDFGCQGGLMDNAFNWIIKSAKGVCSESSYEYTSGTTSSRGQCLESSCEPVPGTVPQGFYDIPPNEPSLIAALNEHGPVAVAIEADQSAFQFYHSGVLTGRCGNRLDHGVLLVGYGVDSDTGLKFWKVKNSWGSFWGEDGYVRIQRGKRWPRGGECGIAKQASYPIL